MTNRNLHQMLQQRLDSHQQWANDFIIYFKHCEISETVSKEYYEKRFFLSIIIKIYFFPFNLLKTFNKARAQHTYQKCLTEIQVLKNLLRLK